MARILFLETHTGKTYMPGDLEYGSCVAKEIAPKLSDMGHKVIEVTKPNARDANNAINEHNPHLVEWVGHGNAHLTSLESMDIWISESGQNLDILNDSIGDAMSCITARSLGPTLCQEHGCNAYLGYHDSFWFIAWRTNGRWDPCPCGEPKKAENIRDKVWYPAFKCMHEANLNFVIGMAQGKTAGEAHQQALNRFDHWITYFGNITPQNEDERNLCSDVIEVLHRDKPVQKLCGDPDATIPTPGPGPGFDLRPLALLGSCIGLAGLTYMKPR